MISDANAVTTAAHVSLEYWNAVSSIIVGLGGALVGAVATAWASWRVQTRQTEYVDVRKRYLDEGVDCLAANIDRALGIYNQNFKVVLKKAGTFKDCCEANIPLKPEEIRITLVDWEPMLLSALPHHRVCSLIGDKCFWDLTQHVLVFLDKTHHNFSEMAMVVEKYLDKNLTTSSSTIIETQKSRLEEFTKESFKYPEIVGYLTALAQELERRPLRYKDLPKFGKRPEVIRIVTDAKSLLAKFEKSQRENKDSHLCG